MIAEVRSLVDEVNQDALTNTEILGALTRAQSHASSLLARLWPAPLLATHTYDEPSTQDLELPDDAMADSIRKVECMVNGLPHVLVPISELETQFYELSENQTSQIPQAYLPIGRQIRQYPSAPTPTTPIRLWYLKRLLPLDSVQGQITSVGSNFVIVEAANSEGTIAPDVSQSQNQNASYVSVFSGETGKLKGTFQVNSIIDGKVTFRTTPVRDEVWDLPVSDAADLTTAEVSADDLVCLAGTSCVPVLKDAVGEFIIQHAFLQAAIKLGGDRDAADDLAKQFEKDLKATYGGRQTNVRVQRTNRNWGGSRGGWSRPYARR